MRFPHFKRLKPAIRRLRRSVPGYRDWLLLLAGALLMLASLHGYNLMKNHQQPLQPQSLSVHIPWVPVSVQRWKTPIAEMSARYDIDPDLLAIIITMESGGYSQARSEVGAQGLMQIMPQTAQDIAAKFLKQPVKTYDIYDPRTNIEFGAAYLAHLRDTFGQTTQGPSWNSTVELVAAGYNGGPGAAGRLEEGAGLQSMQTVAYSRDAYNMWRERHAAISPTFTRWAERGGSSLLGKAKAEQKL